jgi:hypothetical protein
VKEEKKEEKKEEPKTETKEEKTADKKAEKDDLEDLDLNEPKSASASEVKMSAQEEADDLQSLKEDIGDVIFAKDKPKDDKEKEKKKEAPKTDTEASFDVVGEEKKLLDESKLLQQKISAKEWDDISTKAKTEKYEVIIIKRYRLSQNTSESFQVIKDFYKLSNQVNTIEQPLDSTDPEQDLMFLGIFNSIARRK